MICVYLYYREFLGRAAMIDIHTSINVHPKEYISLDAGCASTSSLERTSSGAIHRKLESGDRSVCVFVNGKAWIFSTAKDAPKFPRQQVESSVRIILA